MKLSSQNAMSIVTEISAIIGQHVNLMDELGYIIASTDPTRIGTFHQGAAVVVADQREMLVIEDSAQFEGSRRGINLPLILNGQHVGVIGVTGDYHEVIKYGQIIKKMTEAMMQENYEKEQKKIDDRIHSRFLDEWVLDGAAMTGDMVERGARLGIDIRKPYRVIVAVISNLHQYSDTAEGQMMIDSINRRVRRLMLEGVSGGVFTKTATKMICLYPGASLTNASMMLSAEALIEMVQKEFGVALHVGIDGNAENVHQSYQQASKAVQGCRIGGKSLCLYDDIGLEIFLDEVPMNLRYDFVRRIFHGCTDGEMEQFAAILSVYFETNGSIAKTAERLFLHKNTLQYRLKKISEKTGYDPRQMTDSALMYLAIQFYQASRTL